MKSLKISVVIPCYNASKTIYETLDSLACQTRIPDEVICVDDGSTDNTFELLNCYVQSTSLRIQLVQQENSGVSVARNTGVQHAVGDILLFLDADDQYAPFFIEMVEKQMNEQVDTVYGYYTHLQNEIEGLNSEPIIAKKERKIMMDEFMFYKNRYHTSAFAYKKEILAQNHICFTPHAKYGEDWEFTTKYLDCCKTGVRIDENVMFYRRSDTSAMGKLTYDHVDAIASAIRVEQFLKEKKSDYFERFNSYMRHKAIFSVAHTFARKQDKSSYKQLQKEYFVRESMKCLLHHSEVRFSVKIAALSFLISPTFFFYITGRR